MRAAAMSALATIGGDDAAMLARPLLTDPDPRIRATAAVALAGIVLARRRRCGRDGRWWSCSATDGDAARRARRDVAAALRQIDSPRFRLLLVPLLYDPAPEVANEAMESVQAAGAAEFIFVPTLVALLRHRQLKGPRPRRPGQLRRARHRHARALPARSGRGHLDPPPHAGHARPDSRRRRAWTFSSARSPERDGFLRYKAVAALDRLRRSDAPLTCPREPIEALALQRGAPLLHLPVAARQSLRPRVSSTKDTLLARALEQKMQRTRDRIYRLLGLLYPVA